MGHSADSLKFDNGSKNCQMKGSYFLKTILFISWYALNSQGFIYFYFLFTHNLCMQGNLSNIIWVKELT